LRILVISDTHIPARGKELPGKVREAADCADLILHAGDLVSEQIAHNLQEAAPLHAVVGNMDPDSIQKLFPRRREMDCDGLRIGMMHGDILPRGGPQMDRSALEQFPQADVIVLGHTHVPKIRCVDGVWVFNPGSCTDPRDGSPRTYGWIDIKQSKPHMSILQIK